MRLRPHATATRLLSRCALAQAAALAAALAAGPGAAQAQIAMPAAAASAPRPAGAASAPRPARAASAPQELKRVEITSSGENAQRRASTAAKIIVGREEIEKYGDSTVGDVLKRLPGVTQGGRPGRGGDIRMRGLGSGYTLILINGERMPAGFSLESLTPEQVERIEILRAPTAEYGARAIAGIINIVLREALQKRLNDLKLGFSTQNGRFNPGFSWTRNDKLFDLPGSAYNLTFSGFRTDRLDDIDIRTTRFDPRSGALLLDQKETGTTHDTRHGVHFNSRIQIRTSPENNFTITPFFVASRGETEVRRRIDPASTFASAETQSENDFTTARLNLQWNRRIDDASRLELRSGGGGFESNSHSRRNEFGSSGTLSRGPLIDDSKTTERSWTIAGKYSHDLASEHSLVTGGEIDISRRKSTFRSNDPLLEDVESDYAVSSRRSAVYIQDEWNPTKQWSANAGLRWEGIQIDSEASSGGAAIRNRSSVWTPLLHAVWKPDEQARDQIRLSLTRSYRPPPLQNLVGRYVPSVRPNSPTATDRTGNPDLRPELSTGIDLAFEHYLSAGGLVSANIFRRNIDGLIRTVIEQRVPPGGGAPRWVSQPRNVGNAVSQGIELEAKARLNEFLESAPSVNLRSNLSIFRSRVEGVPGPNNRLDQQPTATANLGGDYRLKSWPVMIGGNVNYTPAYVVQQTAAPNPVTTIRSSIKRTTEFFVQWTVNPALQIRLAAADLPPLDYTTSTTVETDSFRETAENHGKTRTQWTLRLELKL